MTELIHDAAIAQIERYKNLQLGGKSVTCPYYMNLARAKDLRAMVGKGLPEEIEIEARIWEKLKGVDFQLMTEKEIKDFLKNRNIGIECSGFVVHVLDKMVQQKKGKHIWRFLKLPKKDFLNKIAYLLKPVEKLGADIITNNENSVHVDVKDVRPGDLIRSKWKRKNSHHVMLVYKVIKDDSGNVSEIHYVNSTEQYGDSNGVREGFIKVIDQSKPLQEQEWVDFDENGVNHTLEGFMVEVSDNGLRRLKFLA